MRSAFSKWAGEFSSKGLHHAIHTLFLGAALLLLCLPAFSQVNQGTIQGSVFDQTGGAIAGATVTVTDPARGTSRTLTTDAAGAYVAPNLIPATYVVRGVAMGFQTVEHANVVVNVGQTTRVDLTLLPGAQTQTVTVTSETPAVNTTDATLGGEVNNQEVNDLPLNGRNYQRLLQLRPGVVAAIGSGTGSTAESSNGLRGGENLTMIEGISTIASQNAGSILNTSYHQGDATSLLPVDSIQEFNIEQNAKAEFGWKPGAVVNIGVKSGTNNIHGTAYAFGRTNSLDASNYFVGQVPIALEQPGGSIGGRILKDKLFWFASFEALHYSVGDAALDTLPSDDPNSLTSTVDPNNKLTIFDACSAIVGSPANYSLINPLSALIAGLPTNASGVATSCVPQPASPTHENMFPFVTADPASSTQAATFAPGLTTTNAFYNGLYKMDYNLTDHNHLNGMFYISRGNSTVQQYPGQVLPIWEALQTTKTYDYALTEVWTPSSSWVNELRGGYAYLRDTAVPADYQVTPSNPWPVGYGMPTGVTGSPQPITGALYGGSPKISISGFTGFLGSSQHLSNRGPEGTVDIVDNVSYLHGQHSFKFGGEYLRQIEDNQQYNDGNGAVSFSSLQNFLTGTVKNGSILLGNADTWVRMNLFAGFVQDDWRVTKKVTLNLGLRYEYDGPPTEKLGNYIGQFYPNVNPATTSALGQAGGPFPTLFHPDKADFAPRFGVAWDVQGNGKTVVRAGAGLIYSFDSPGSILDLVPFGANVPYAGVNNSGTLANLFSPETPTLTASQMHWNTANNLSTGQTIFPNNLATTINGVSYTGPTCTYPGEPSGPGTFLSFTSATQCGSNAVTASNFHTPKVAEWNLDIQRAITNNLTIEVAYVGNHGWAPSRDDINQAPLGWGWNGPTSGIPSSMGGPLPGGESVATYCLNQGAAAAGCLASAENGKANSTEGVAYIASYITGAPYFSSFPYLSNIDQTANLDYSNYNGLQVTVTERPVHGLTFLLGYTLSHALDIASTDSVGNEATDSAHPNLNYGTSANDARHRFSLAATYAVPGIKVPAQMLQGWSVSTVLRMSSGLPWGANDATNDFLGTNELNNSFANNFQPWNYSGKPSAFTTVTHGEIPCFGTMTGCTAFQGGVPPAVCVAAAQAPYAGNATLQQLALDALLNNGCYVENGGILTPPAYGTIGDAPKNIFRGPAFYNVDLSVAKLWKIKERYTATFRMEFFNLFNRADFTTPAATDPAAGGQFGCTCATPDELGFTNAVLGAGAARAAQLGLKLSW